MECIRLTDPRVKNSLITAGDFDEFLRYFNAHIETLNQEISDLKSKIEELELYR